MFESFAIDLLNRYLGEYVENLNIDQVSIGVWNGNVHLENLVLKKDALKALELPIEVLSGIIGKLTLKIPWSRIKSEPAEVFVEDLYILARPRDLRSAESREEVLQYSLEKSEKLLTMLDEFLRSKLRQEVVDSYDTDEEEDDESEGDKWGEELGAGKGDSGVEDGGRRRGSGGKRKSRNADVSGGGASSQDTFTSKLLAKVVENLQLSVSNVHFRMEDSMLGKSSTIISKKSFRQPLGKEQGNSTPFALGVTISSLTVQSTNDEWVPQYVYEDNPCVYKLVSMESMAMYWNCNCELYSEDAPIVSVVSHGQSGSLKERIVERKLLDNDTLRSPVYLKEKLGAEIGREGDMGKEELPDSMSYLLQPCSGAAKVGLLKEIRLEDIRKEQKGGVGGGRRNDMSVQPLLGRVDEDSNSSVPRPRFSMEIVLDDIPMCLMRSQYACMVRLLNFFASFEASSEMAQKRPSCSVKENPKEWWRFCIGVIVDKIKYQNSKYKWEYLKKRRSDRLEYVSLYQQFLMKDQPLAYYKNVRETRQVDLQAVAASPEEGRMLVDLIDFDSLYEIEKQREFDDIRYFRHLALATFSKADILEFKERYLRKNTDTTGGNANQGWLSSWFWGSSAASNTEHTLPYETADSKSNGEERGSESKSTDDLGLNLDESQRAVLFDVIGYSEEEATQTDDSIIPKWYVSNTITITIKSGSFTLQDDLSSPLDRKRLLKSFSGSDTSNSMFTLQLFFANFCVGLSRREAANALKVEVTLGNLLIRDKAMEHCLFPVFMCPKGSSNRYISSGIGLEKLQSEGKLSSNAFENEQFWSLSYETNPLQSTADSKLLVLAKPIEIAFNATTAFETLKFFESSEGFVMYSEELTTAVGARLEALKIQTKADIIESLEKHKVMEIFCDISAPVIVFPETFIKGEIHENQSTRQTKSHSRNDCQLLVVDLGNVIIRSTDKVGHGDEDEFVTPPSSPPSPDSPSLMTEPYMQALVDRKPLALVNVDLKSLSMADLEAKLYDSFTLDMKDLNLYSCRLSTFLKYSENADKHQRKESIHHLVQPFNISVEINKCIRPHDPRFTKYKFFAKLVELNLVVSEKSLPGAMRCVNELIYDATKYSRNRTSSAVNEDVSGSFYSYGKSFSERGNSSDILRGNSFIGVDVNKSFTDVSGLAGARSIAELSRTDSIITSSVTKRTRRASIHDEKLLGRVGSTSKTHKYLEEGEASSVKKRSVIRESSRERLLSSDSVDDTVERVLVEMCFDIGSVKAVVMKTTEMSSVSADCEQPVVTVLIREAHIAYASRTFDHKVDFGLGAFSAQDHMCERIMKVGAGNEKDDYFNRRGVLRYIVTSDELGEQASDRPSSDTRLKEQLIRASYCRVSSKSPQFYTEYNGVHSNVNISFNKLKLVTNTKTFSEVMKLTESVLKQAYAGKYEELGEVGFGSHVGLSESFKVPSEASLDKAAVATSSEGMDPVASAPKALSTVGGDAPSGKSTNAFLSKRMFHKKRKTNVTAVFKEFQVKMMTPTQRVFAELEVSGLSMEARMDGVRFSKLLGRLKNATLTDCTPEGHLYREAFATCGDEALVFEYTPQLNSYDSTGDRSQFDALLKIRMTSIRCTYTSRFFDIVSFHMDMLQDMLSIELPSVADASTFAVEMLYSERPNAEMHEDSGNENGDMKLGINSELVSNGVSGGTGKISAEGNYFKTQLDIVVSSPIIIIPRFAGDSSMCGKWDKSPISDMSEKKGSSEDEIGDILVVYLGKIVISNRFIDIPLELLSQDRLDDSLSSFVNGLAKSADEERLSPLVNHCVCDSIELAVQNCSVYSSNINDSNEVHSLILKETGLRLNFLRCLDKGDYLESTKGLPSLAVLAKVSPLSVYFSKHNYNQLVGSLTDNVWGSLEQFYFQQVHDLQEAVNSEKADAGNLEETIWFLPNVCAEESLQRKVNEHRASNSSFQGIDEREMPIVNDVNQKMFLSFSKLQLTLKGNQSSSEDNNSTLYEEKKDKELVALMLESLDCSFTNKHYSVGIEASLSGFEMCDLTQPQESDCYVIGTSKLNSLGDDVSEEKSGDKGELVNVAIVQVDPLSPDFEEVYKSTEKEVIVTINRLKMNVNLETSVMLLDFFGIIHGKEKSETEYRRKYSGFSKRRLEGGTKPEDSGEAKASKRRLSSLRSQSSQRGFGSDPDLLGTSASSAKDLHALLQQGKEVVGRKSVLEPSFWTNLIESNYMFNINSLTAVMFKPSGILGSASMTGVSVSVKKYLHGVVEVEGSLGQMFLKDLTTMGAYYEDIFLCENNVLNFHIVNFLYLNQSERNGIIEMWNKKLPDVVTLSENPDNPFDVSLRVVMKELHFVYNSRFISELITYFNNFMYMKNFLWSMYSLYSENEGETNAFEEKEEIPYVGSENMFSPDISNSRNRFSGGGDYGLPFDMDDIEEAVRRDSDELPDLYASSHDAKGCEKVSEGTSAARSTRVQLVIQMKSPVLIIPKNSFSPYVLLIYPGDVAVTNKFEMLPHDYCKHEPVLNYPGTEVDLLKIEVTDMSVFSGKRSECPYVTSRSKNDVVRNGGAMSSESKRPEYALANMLVRRFSPIIDNFSLTFCMQRNIEIYEATKLKGSYFHYFDGASVLPDGSRVGDSKESSDMRDYAVPDMKIFGVVSDVKFKLSECQYELLYGILYENMTEMPAFDESQEEFQKAIGSSILLYDTSYEKAFRLSKMRASRAGSASISRSSSAAFDQSGAVSGHTLSKRLRNRPESNLSTGSQLTSNADGTKKPWKTFEIDFQFENVELEIFDVKKVPRESTFGQNHDNDNDNEKGFTAAHANGSSKFFGYSSSDVDAEAYSNSEVFLNLMNAEVDSWYNSDKRLHRKCCSLARLDFRLCTLSYESWSNSTHLTEIDCPQIAVHDSRDYTKNVFTEILKPGCKNSKRKESVDEVGSVGSTNSTFEKSPQLHITIRGKGTQQNINVLLDNNKIHFVFDWMLLIKSFWFAETLNMDASSKDMVSVGSKINRTPSNWDVESDDKLMSPSSVNAANSVTMNTEESVIKKGRKLYPSDVPKYIFQLSVSITDPEFVILEDVTSLNTSAVGAKFCCALNYKLINGTTEKVTMVWQDITIFSYGVNQPTATDVQSSVEALSIVDPFNITVNVTRVLKNEILNQRPTQTETRELFLGVEDFDAKVSYHDIKLLLCIVNSLPANVWAHYKGDSSSNGTSHAESIASQFGSSGESSRRGSAFNLDSELIHEIKGKEAGEINSSKASEAIRSIQNTMESCQPMQIDSVGGSNSMGSLSGGSKQKSHISEESLAAIEKKEKAISSGTIFAQGSGHGLSYHEKIGKLQSLGYTREWCAVALDKTKNSMASASLWLFEEAPRFESSRISAPKTISRRNSLALNSGGSETDLGLEKDECILCIVEKLNACANSMNFTLINDCKGLDIPLFVVRIRELEVELQDWSHTLKGLGSARTSANYYNVRNASWEPLVENWSANVQFKTKFESCGPYWYLGFTSPNRLEVTLSKTFIDTFIVTQQEWTEDYFNNPRSKRQPFVPYVLKNETGDPLLFWLSKGTKSHDEASLFLDNVESCKVHVVEDGKSEPFSFTKNSSRASVFQTKRKPGANIKAAKSIVIQLREHLPSKPVLVDVVGTFVVDVERDSGPVRGVTEGNESKSGEHFSRVVFDIELKNGGKQITIRSAFVFVNELIIPIEFRMDIPSGHGSSLETVILGTAPPGESVAIPVNHVLDAKVLVRPYGLAYNWSSQCISWVVFKRITGKSIGYLTCKGEDETDRFIKLCVETEKESIPEEMRPFPCHKFTISAPIVLQNLLPVSVQYAIVDTSMNELLEKGQSVPLFHLDMKNNILMKILVQNYQWSGTFLINTSNPDLPVATQIPLKDGNDRILNLRVKNEQLLKSGPRTISLYCDYWMINTTGLPLMYKQEGKFTQAAAGQFENAYFETLDCKVADEKLERGKKAEPFMFAYSNEDDLDDLRCRVRAPRTHYSQAFGLDAVGRTGYVMLREKHGEGKPDSLYEIGIKVRMGRGRFYMTKVIHFMPRFLLVNSSSFPIRFSQQCMLQLGPRTATTLPETFWVLEPGDREPFHWPRADRDQLFCISLPDLGYKQWLWSGGFTIDGAGEFHVKVRSKQNFKQAVILKVDIKVVKAMFVVIFRNYEGIQPFRLENMSHVSINYHQTDVSMVETLAPLTSCVYVWDQPSLPHMLKLYVTDTDYRNAQEYPLSEIHRGSPLYYRNYFYIHLSNNLVLDVEHVSNARGETFTLVVLNNVSMQRPGCDGQLWQMTIDGKVKHKLTGLVLDSLSSSERGTSSNPFITGSLLCLRAANDYSLTQQWRIQNHRLVCVKCPKYVASVRADIPE
eukprot:Nk52_evm42s1444 gene=Nk52_evmTU42s1444